MSVDMLKVAHDAGRKIAKTRDHNAQTELRQVWTLLCQTFVNLGGSATELSQAFKSGAKSATN